MEGLLSVLARACLVMGVEAIVESWVSVMENHSSSVRCITNQKRLEDEVCISHIQQLKKMFSRCGLR